MTKFTSDSALAVLELEQMLIGYWREVDQNGGLNAASFFMEDCTYIVGPTTLKGHTGVRKYYTDRSESMRAQNTEPRTSRHTYVNLEFLFEGQDQAALNFLLISYAGFGALPIMDNTSPVSISDARLVCRRHADGDWRILDYKVTPIFVDGAQFAKRAPKAS